MFASSSSKHVVRSSPTTNPSEEICESYSRYYHCTFKKNHYHLAFNMEAWVALWQNDQPRHASYSRPTWSSRFTWCCNSNEPSEHHATYLSCTETEWVWNESRQCVASFVAAGLEMGSSWPDLSKLERSRDNDPVPHTAATGPLVFPYAKNLTNSIRVAIQNMFFEFSRGGTWMDMILLRLKQRKEVLPSLFARQSSFV